jgi:glycosyltransferase involved in cell wall biosynthesis
MGPSATASDRPVVVSIVTISNDDPEGLRKTINSVLAQDFGDFELILIRGGTSQSLALPSDERLIVVDEPARGISRAFNSGVGRVRGAWVQFLNGGDAYIGTSAMGQLVAAGRQDVRMVLSFARVDGRSFTIPRRALRCGQDSFYYASHQASLFRRELFGEFGMFSPRIKVRMDLEWLTRLPRSTPYAFTNAETVRFDATGVSANNVVQSSLEEVRILWRVPQARWRAICVLIAILPFRVARLAWRRIR